MKEKNQIEITPEEFFNATQAIMHRVEKKLDYIIAYIDKVDSEAYRNNEDAKQMVMNIIADVFADGRLKPNNFNR